VLDRLLRTPRDLARYLNGVQLLVLSRRTWDLNIDDALYVAALQVFFPGTYDRVRPAASS